jgi:hypothetical protein
MDLVQKNDNTVYILGSGLELLKVGCYDLPHPRYGPRNTHLFLNGP